MQGLRVERSGKYSLALLEDLSKEFKAHTSSQLSAICFGATLAKEDPDYYSFKKTMIELNTRFSAKSRDTRLGMAGELLVHLITDLAFPDLEKTTIYFNKEERSIKKGFDLTYTDSADRLWYAEVKSGETHGLSVPQKQTSLASLALSDLQQKFEQPTRRSIWDNAIFDAQSVLSESKAKTTKALLRADALETREGTRRVMLATTVFHPHADYSTTQADIDSVYKAMSQKSNFADLRILAIQKSTLEKFADYLATEGAP